MTEIIGVNSSCIMFLSLFYILLNCFSMLLALEISDFYQVTPNSTLPAGDDLNSGPISLMSPFPFFGSRYDNINVSMSYAIAIEKLLHAWLVQLQCAIVFYMFDLIHKTNTSTLLFVVHSYVASYIAPVPVSFLSSIRCDMYVCLNSSGHGCINFNV